MYWQALIGIGVFLGLAWLCSENKRAINYKMIGIGLGVQLSIALALTELPFMQRAFLHVSHAIDALKAATQAGTTFVFGHLGGGTAPFLLNPSAPGDTFIFAFQALPMVIVISALSMLLFHFRILPMFVKFSSLLFQKVLGLGGALGVATAAKIFLGNIEVSMLVRPYLKNFSRSELFTVLTCGMATTSATMITLYTDILANTLPNPVSHLLIATFISILSAIIISRIIVPSTQAGAQGELVAPYKFSSWMDAVVKGASDGLNVFLNIIAMLIVALALTALTNSILSLLPDVFGHPITLQRMLGYVMSPLAWLMGIPWEECILAGQLLGTKTVLNEVVAFIDLAQVAAPSLTSHATMVMIYALCGFANLSGVAIVMGGIGAMIPERRDEIINLTFKSLWAGTLASCLSGALISFLSSILH